MDRHHAFVYDSKNVFSSVNSLIVSIIPFVQMAAPHPALGEASSWICCEGLSSKPPVGWDIARGKIFVKLQSACVQHIQLKAKSHCENMQLDMPSKRIFNAFHLVQIQHVVHSGMLVLSFHTGMPYISSSDISSHHAYLHIIKERMPHIAAMNQHRIRARAATGFLAVPRECFGLVEYLYTNKWISWFPTKREVERF